MSIESVVTSLCEKFSVSVVQLSTAVISYQRVSTGITTLVSFFLFVLSMWLTPYTYKKFHSVDHHSDLYDILQAACLLSAIIFVLSLIVFVIAFIYFCTWCLAPEGAFINYLVDFIK